MQHEHLFFVHTHAQIWRVHIFLRFQWAQTPYPFAIHGIVVAAKRFIGRRTMVWLFYSWSLLFISQKTNRCSTDLEGASLQVNELLTLYARALTQTQICVCVIMSVCVYGVCLCICVYGVCFVCPSVCFICLCTQMSSMQLPNSHAVSKRPFSS